MRKSRFLFKIYYIGGQQYHGSQRQSDVITIEHCLLNALIEKKYIQKPNNSEFEFASRTDRFVSARGACFTCVTQKEPKLMEINSVLPKDIGIWAYSEVPLEFSSRYNAILRHYVYIVSTPISYLQNTSGLNVEIMKEACKQLEGRHNFVNFSKKEIDMINTIRDMDSATLSTKDDYLIFQFKSKSFLRQQIRRIVKKVLELGKYEITYDDFLELFNDSKAFSYQPADPRGLILWDIKFNDEIMFIEDQKSKERRNNFFQTKELEFGFKHQLFRALQQNDFS
ncbi:MAG: tRNA pseudouridine synthase A [Candidatus Hodarchaeota archaeon]